LRLLKPGLNFLSLVARATKKRQDDQEVNTTYRGDRKDHRNCQQQSSDQKEKRHFCRPDDVGKWCEIHRTSGHDLEECKFFLDRKKMPPPVAQVAQEPQRWASVQPHVLRCNVDISFKPQDHPDTELSDRNLSFVVKLSIRRYNMVKTLIDNGALLNLIMRKTFIDMGFNLKDLTLVHDTFHGIIP
jgi:hypothetical protein